MLALCVWVCLLLATTLQQPQRHYVLQTHGQTNRQTPTQASHEKTVDHTNQLHTTSAHSRPLFQIPAPRSPPQTTNRPINRQGVRPLHRATNSVLLQQEQLNSARRSKYQIPAPPAAPLAAPPVAHQPIVAAHVVHQPIVAPPVAPLAAPPHRPLAKYTPSKAALSKKKAKLRVYLNKQRRHHDNAAQQHDADRELFKVFLLFRLYKMLQSYLARMRDVACREVYVSLRVGTLSPVFGGVMFESPRVYLKGFSVSGYDDSMSRVELYGCKTLPKTATDQTTNPCGPGSSTLLWSWYNGQDTVTLPPNTTVLAGHDTNVQFLVGKLTKFRLSKKGDISLQQKLVKANFKVCKEPEAWHASSYKFAASRGIQLRKFLTPRHKVKIDISCRHNGTPFLVYGYIGRTGIFGKNISVWRNNGKQKLIGSVNSLNKIHKLGTLLQIETGDVIQVRCEYVVPVITPYPDVHNELCQLHLLIMINSTLAPFAPVCSQVTDFVNPADQQESWDTLRWVQCHQYVLLLAVCMICVMVYYVAMFGCRREKREIVGGEEVEGLMSDYSSMKLK